MQVATGFTFNVRYRPLWNTRIVRADGTRGYSQNLQSCRGKLTGRVGPPVGLCMSDR